MFSPQYLLLIAEKVVNYEVEIYPIHVFALKPSFGLMMCCFEIAMVAYNYGIYMMPCIRQFTNTYSPHVRSPSLFGSRPKTFEF